MKTKLLMIITCVSLLFCITADSAQAAERAFSFNTSEQALVPIASFAAAGDMVRLESALKSGLEAGLTVNIIKEALIQIYPYAGFPRSLNALNCCMSLLKKRKEAGIIDKQGKKSETVLNGINSVDAGTRVQTKLLGRTLKGELFEFAPAIDYYLKAHLFGDIFARDALDHRTREVITVSALANMEGVSSQLMAHFGIAMNTGLTKDHLKTLISVLKNKVSQEKAEKALQLLNKILTFKKIETIDSSVLKKSENPKRDKSETNLDSITVTHTSRIPAVRGANDKFSGTVNIDTFFKASKPSHFGGANVEFMPGARTAWHSHTLGQLLIVTSGKGLICKWGEPAAEMTKGDVVWIPPFVKHWHGAAPDSAVTHIAILEQIGEKNATQWLEKVSDEQYKK